MRFFLILVSGAHAGDRIGSSSAEPTNEIDDCCSPVAKDAGSCAKDRYDQGAIRREACEQYYFDQIAEHGKASFWKSSRQVTKLLNRDDFHWFMPTCKCSSQNIYNVMTKCSQSTYGSVFDDLVQFGSVNTWKIVTKHEKLDAKELLNANIFKAEGLCRGSENGIKINDDMPWLPFLFMESKEKDYFHQLKFLLGEGYIDVSAPAPSITREECVANVFDIIVKRFGNVSVPLWCYNSFRACELLLVPHLKKHADDIAKTNYDSIMPFQTAVRFGRCDGDKKTLPQHIRRIIVQCLLAKPNIPQISFEYSDCATEIPTGYTRGVTDETTHLGDTAYHVLNTRLKLLSKTRFLPVDLSDLDQLPQRGADQSNNSYCVLQ